MDSENDTTELLQQGLVLQMAHEPIEVTNWRVCYRLTLEIRCPKTSRLKELGHAFELDFIVEIYRNLKDLRVLLNPNPNLYST